MHKIRNDTLPYANNMYKDFVDTESFYYHDFIYYVDNRILDDSCGYITYLVDTGGYIDITPLSIAEFNTYRELLCDRPYLKVVWHYTKNQN